VLSDESKRKAYDEFGEIALDPNFDAERVRQATGGFGGFGGGHAGGGIRFEDLGGFGNVFEDLFGGLGGQPRRRRGADIEAELPLDLTDASRGCEQRITIQRGGAPETLTVRIPPGVGDGAKIRLPDKGQPGSEGAPSGHLYVTVRIRPHKLFRREGRDLHLDLPVTVAEAIAGTEIDIPTLEGRVKLRIPPGTDGGARLRLRGKGIAAGGGQPAGDLFVTVRIKVPKDVDPEALEALTKDPTLAGQDAASLRKHLDEDA